MRLSHVRRDCSQSSFLETAHSDVVSSLRGVIAPARFKDNGNPMNPHGLLIAYAEAMVKPVVSES